MSRSTSGRAVERMSVQYRAAAHAGDWALCKTIAEQMRGLGGNAAEVQYALAYALEQLGEIKQAHAAYDVVLVIDRRQEKAQARLRALAIRG